MARRCGFVSHDLACATSSPFEDPCNAERNQQGQLTHANSDRPPPTAGRKHKFLSALPSFSSACVPRNLTEFRKTTSLLEDDRAMSEWETIAPGDEHNDRDSLMNPTELGSPPNFELLFHAQDILHSSSSHGSLGLRRNTIPGPLNLPQRQRLPAGKSRLNLPTQQSFCSSSSFYSDAEAADELCDVELPQWNGPSLNQVLGRKRPATLGLERDGLAEPTNWTRFSKASSSTGGDPFKYDAVAYSAFLQPAAEREVSSALRRIGVSDNSMRTTHPFPTDHIDSQEKKPNSSSSFYHPEAIRST